MQLLLSFLNPVFAQETKVSDTFAEQLNKAVYIYHSGDKDNSMRLFLDLSHAKEAPIELRLEARVYIAEIHFVQKNVELSQAEFSKVLDEDKDYNIDRFRHPPDVCEYFDWFKKEYYKTFAENQNGNTLQPNPMPISGYAPLGAYNLMYGPKWKGYTYFGTQGTLALTSLGLFIALAVDHQHNDTDVEKKERLEGFRTVQWISTIAFYSLWATSIIDAQRDWQLNHSQQSLKDNTNKN